MFNLEAGVDPSQDTLPKRLLKEPIAAGPSQGHVHRLDELLPQYYTERGWDATGLPTAERLASLEILAEPIDIEVRLFATFRHGRFGMKRLRFHETPTVGDLCKHLAIAQQDVAIRMVNGHEAAVDQPLQQGDRVSLFPAVGGG